MAETPDEASGDMSNHPQWGNESSGMPQWDATPVGSQQAGAGTPQPLMSQPTVDDGAVPPPSQQPAAEQSAAGAQPSSAPAQSSPGTSGQSRVGGAPNNFTWFSDARTILRLTWAGRSPEALATVGRARNFGWFALLFESLVLGLFFTNVGVMLVNITNGVINSKVGSRPSFLDYDGTGSTEWISIDAGYWFEWFLILAILAAVFFLVRAAFIQATLRSRQVQIRYADALSLAGAARLTPVVVAFVVAVLGFIPSPGFAKAVIVVGFLAFLTADLLAELIIYIGINRSGRMQQSPLVPHTLFTGLFLLIIVIVLWVLIQIGMQ